MNSSASLLANDTQLISHRAEEIVSRWQGTTNVPVHAENNLVQGAIRTTLSEPAAAATLTAGKRMRPLLCFWMWRSAYGFWSQPESIPSNVLDIGCAAELLHAASLVIDDIQDGSQVRRGEPSVHTRFGAPIAINAANWLYFEAMAMLVENGCSADSVISMMRTCHFGQAMDLASSLPSVIAATIDAHPLELSDFYNQIAHQKTAALMRFAVCAVLEPSKHPSSLIQAASNLFDLYGLIYQKADDLRNINESISGSKANEDLASIRNYVTILLIKQLSVNEKRELIKASQARELRDWLLTHPRFSEAVEICAAELQCKLKEAKRLAEEICPHDIGLDYLNSVIHSPVSELIRHAHGGAVKRAGNDR